MKSYIEPLNAADALDVLDLYGIDAPGAFFSSEHEGCDYGLDSISETTEDAAVGYFDPTGAVDDEKFLTSADWALCDIESSVLTAFGAGCSPELAGWTLGNAESVAETCASLGVDIATAPAPDNPARVAAAAKAATKATTHGVAAAAGNRL